MNASQGLFHKLVDPYHSTTQTAQLADLHSLFWQQLPEIAEYHARPQAKKAVLDLQNRYRQLLAFILYPQLADTSILTVRGESQHFLQALQLDWYELPIPLFVHCGNESVEALNLFQSPQTFSFEELAELPVEFSHLLQHILIQTPMLQTNQCSFLLPKQDELLVETDYSLSFITDDNWDVCWQFIQQRQQGHHYLVNLSSRQFDEALPRHMSVLPTDNWLTALQQQTFMSSNHQLLQEMDTLFLSYEHSLELLLSLEHKQLAKHASEPLRMTKHQQQLKVYQEELALWQTFHQRFRRLLAELPALAHFEQLPQSQAQSGMETSFQVYQQRVKVDSLGYHNHPFEKLLLIAAKPLPSTPMMREHLADYLTTYWDLPHNLAFTHTLIQLEGNTNHEST
ncbi:MAG: hypothetical protein ACRC5Q_00710 [Culicoidibacterales bacterium]